MSASGTLPFPHAKKGAFPELARLLERIEAAFAPEAVLLFGSRARGDARPDSDWDLAVLLADGADPALLDPVLGWEAQRGSGVHADVVAAFASEFAADLNVVNTLAYSVRSEAVRIR